MALSLKERLEKLNEVEATIKKDYGTGIVVVDGDYPRIPRWQLSSPTFNFILGGGYPAGRIIEIYGPESSGKTTINTQAAADIQKQGGYVVWVDAEHCFDPEYAHKFGLLTDQEHFTLIKPDSGEDALQIVIRYAASGVVDLIVVDSVAALVPKAELEGEMSDNQMGAQARMMGKAMRKLAGIASKSGTCVSFINQIRMKIGVMFGNPETTPGGNALKFYASIRLEIRKSEYITGKDADDHIGIKSKITAKKNKTASPFRKGEVDIYFDRGIDPFVEYINFAISYGILEKNKNTYLFDGEKIGVGLNQVTEFMRCNELLYERIKTLVNQQLSAPTKITPEEPVDEETDGDTVEGEEPLFEPLTEEEEKSSTPPPKKRGRPRKS